jgi:Ca2+-binding RTX toxin-like protein
VESIDGLAGWNTIMGTSGNDILTFAATTLANIGRIDGGAGADQLTGSNAADYLFGGDGNDTLAGGAGNDIVQGGEGIDTISDAAGNNLLLGNGGTDTLTGGTGAEIFAGGTGNDTITTGAGADLIAFRFGDGQDLVNATNVQDNVLSLSGTNYANMTLRKSSNDLVVELGADAGNVMQQLTFKDWYQGQGNRSVATLQVLTEGTDYLAGSADPLRDNKVERFNFQALVTAFDAARAATPNLARWNIASKLLDAHLTRKRWVVTSPTTTRLAVISPAWTLARRTTPWVQRRSAPPRRPCTHGRRSAKPSRRSLNSKD